MSKFHTLTVSDVRRETPDCVSIAFNLPLEKQNAFQYKQGQYLTLKVSVGGEEFRRSYSICSSPANGEALRIAVKEVPNGRVSTYLNRHLAQYAQMEVMEPMGNFTTEMGGNHERHYVAFAAGSGITPILSLMKTALITEPNSRFTLFYGNRSKQSIIFNDELEALQGEHGKRLQIFHILSREGAPHPIYHGRIDAAKCEHIIKAQPAICNADHIFLCGPFEMIQTVQGALESRGVQRERIHFELFTAPVQETENSTAAAPVGFTSSKVKVILDGDEYEVSVPKGTSILDAALEAGLDAPYACTGGSCCTCRAKMLDGNATMDVNYALTDGEVRDGYILTCQSHPTTPTMVVDYDAS
jgi:ring-1,2-phenylacetyl-CoA epoxidase subunit PaaE